MGMKDANAYVKKEHGGWGWWALKCLVTIAGPVLLYLAITGRI